MFRQIAGGYGAIVHGMKYPKVWGAIADHSGDAYFVICVLARLAEHAERARQVSSAKAQGRGLRCAPRVGPQGPRPGLDDGRGRRFLEKISEREKVDAEGHAFMNVCMAAAYDPTQTRRSASASHSTSKRANRSRAAGAPGAAAIPSSGLQIQE